MKIKSIQSLLMYCCLPELNATRVIKITERNTIQYNTIQYLFAIYDIYTWKKKNEEN